MTICPTTSHTQARFEKKPRKNSIGTDFVLISVTTRTDGCHSEQKGCD